MRDSSETIVVNVTTETTLVEPSFFVLINAALRDSELLTNLLNVYVNSH